MKHDFDLIVIGSGPAGQRAAVQAAKINKSVLVIENQKAGGGSAHWGTIPSKSIREATLRPGANWPKALRWAQAVMNQEKSNVEEALERNKIHYQSGSAYFLDANQIGIQGSKKRFSAKKILIATGARPLHLPELPFSWKNVHDSDSILLRKKLPKSLLILGAGVIGCEYASIFAKLGVNVIVSDRRQELLRSVDAEITNILRTEFEKAGIKFVLGAALGDFQQAKGKISVRLGQKKYQFESILICMGRAPNTESLDLGAAGITKDSRGFLPVNENFQTNIPHIYAAGDVIGAPALAATSAEQGRIAACHAFEIQSEKFPALFPCGIYTTPEIASVGPSEEELLAKKIPFVVGRAQYSELSRGHILGDQSGLLKLFVHKQSHELLGTHIIGTGASELVHLGLMLQNLNVKVEFLRNSVFNYPTLAEAYKVAAYNAINQLQTHS